MGDLGQRLKEAMDAAVADAQPPLGLMDRVRRAHRRRYWTMPALAAAVLAVTAVVATTIVPGLLTGPLEVAAPKGLGERFVGMLSVRATRFIVLNAKTGAIVAKISAPGHATTFRNVATGNGVTYAAAVDAPGGDCGFKLYQFTLNSSGKPGRFTPLATSPVGNGSIIAMALSPDGKTFADYALPCNNHSSATLDVINLVTGQRRQWTDPDDRWLESLSFTSGGRLLEYIYYTQTGLVVPADRPPVPPTLYLLRTSARPGLLRARSTVLATGRKFSPTYTMDWAHITPDGRTVYVATTTASTSQGPQQFDQISAVDVATGQVTTLVRELHWAFTYAADPRVTRLIAGYETSGPHRSPQGAIINLRTRQIKILPRSWPVQLYESYFW